LTIALNRAVCGVPLSIGLCFALLICGGNLILTPAIYILSSAVNIMLYYSLLSIFEGLFLTFVTFLYRRAHKKIRAEAIAYLCIALAPFVAFSRWRGADILPVADPYISKTIAAVIVIIFSYFCFKCVYAAMYRLFRCRARSDELVSFAVLFTAAGLGIYNLLGEYICLCLCSFCVIFSIRFFKNPTAVICALVAAMPLALSTFNANYLTVFVCLATLGLLFCPYGRATPSIVCFFANVLYLYAADMFYTSTALIILRILLLLVCFVLPVIPSDKKLTQTLNRLTVKKVLSDEKQARFKARTGDKLFRISEVFREIECAFNNLDDDIDDGAMRARIFKELKENICTDCNKKDKCHNSKVNDGFVKLINIGCIKGKVSLVDLPADVTLNCYKPTEAIASANTLLANYRRYTVEAENAKSGRKLLASQARGIAEVLKSCAADCSRTDENTEEVEMAVSRSLEERGISCPEICVNAASGEVMFTQIGKCDIKTAIEIIENCVGHKLELKDKIVYDNEKSCYILTAPPPYDAAFGVAYAVKEGEKVSGDTHSVIKINEHCFLMALSDGMGSGEYANKISSTTISLIEAFYRAEMPTDIVLDTINKLISFNRDERFACIDIVAVDLNSLCANFIKIGSPAGLIVRQGEIKVLESNSLPLGILDSLHPTVCNEQLKDGDIIVFMSDGITSAFSAVCELYTFLQGEKQLNPQSLADKILQKALTLSGGAADDMTVLCTRIFKSD
jgi:stage II sporulation protein E